MADITLKKNNYPVILDISFSTPQQFFFIVTVLDDQKKQIFHDSGQWNGKTQFDLGNANILTGLYLVIYWTCVDPAGSGNGYNASGTVSQNGNNCKNAQIFSGTTTISHSSATTIGKFL